MLVSFLVVFLLNSFSCSRRIIFYFFFEISVVPIFFLILGWGYRVERFQAGIYIIMYTLLRSLPFLFIIFKSMSETGSFSFFFNEFNIDYFLGFYWLIIIIVFFVKAPVFIVHLWLPKAHVEAPLVGSIILAGVLLKLGGYGLIKIFNLVKISSLSWRVIIVFFFFGSLIISLICLRQIDLKILVAYSSVVHIGFVIARIFISSLIGVKGGYFLIVAHGFCSSGIFFFLNCLYERLGRRRFFILRGGLAWTPILTFFWLMLNVYNMSSPPSFNFVSELIIIIGTFNIHFLLIFIGRIYLFLGGVYCIYLFIIFSHGSLYSVNSNMCSLRELGILFGHIYLLTVIFIARDIIYLWSLKY